MDRLEIILILPLMIQSRSEEGWKAWRSADRTNRGIQKNFSEVGESSFTLDHTKALMESAEVPRVPTISRWNCKNTSAYSANFAFARHLISSLAEFTSSKNSNYPREIARSCSCL